MDKKYRIHYTVQTYAGNAGLTTEDKKEVKKMEFKIVIDGDQWREMCKNRYGQGNVITRSGMLDIVHDIIDQIHEQA